MSAGEIGTSVQTRADAAVATSDETAGGLVRLALEKGVDVAVLERLVALQERVTERNARAAYFEALAAFQEECPQVFKGKTAKIATKTGASYQYSYAPLDEIARAIRPVLRRHGLSYAWTINPGEQAGTLDVVCIVRHIDGHQESARFPVPTASPNEKMSEAQKTGAALTYGKRQSLTSVLGITTTDSDTDAADPRGFEKVSEYEVRTLEARIAEVGADRTRFLAFMGVERLEDIAAADYERGVKALDRKAAR